MNDLNLSTLAPIYPEILQSISWGSLGWILGGIATFVGVGTWLWRREKRAPKTLDVTTQLQKLNFETQPTEDLYAFSLLMQALPPERQPRNLFKLLDMIEPYKYASLPPELPCEIKAQLMQAIQEVTA